MRRGGGCRWGRDNHRSLIKFKWWEVCFAVWSSAPAHPRPRPHAPCSSLTCTGVTTSQTEANAVVTPEVMLHRRMFVWLVTYLLAWEGRVGVGWSARIRALTSVAFCRRKLNGSVVRIACQSKSLAHTVGVVVLIPVSNEGMGGGWDVRAWRCRGWGE